MQSRIGNRQAKVPEWELLPPKTDPAANGKVPLLNPFSDGLRSSWMISSAFPDKTPLSLGSNYRFASRNRRRNLRDSFGSSVCSRSAGRSENPAPRMAMNILINELVGIIPGLGDAFSFWFKSNVRNYELLRRYSAAPARSRRGDWIFVVAVLSLLFVIVARD